MSGREAGHRAEPGAPDPDALEVVERGPRQQFEGWVPELAGENELRQALESAFDYRGDVTITRKDGSRIEGYVFDRRSGRFLPLPGPLPRFL